MGNERRPAEVVADVRDGHIPSVIVLHGPNLFLQHSLVSRIIEAVFPNEKDRVFGVEQYESEEIAPARLLSELRTVPFGLGKKLLLLWRFDPSEDSAKQTEADVSLKDVLIRYFRNPSVRTLLLISCPVEIKKRDSFIKSLPKEAIVVPCLEFREREATAFVKGRIREEGKKASREWIEQFVEMCGVNAGKLDSELEKVVLLTKGRQVLREEDFDIVSPEAFSRDVFSLLDAIIGGNVRNAVEIIREILGGGEPPLRVLAVLLWHYRLVAKRMKLVRQGMDTGNGVVHPSSFVARKVARHARRFTEETLLRTFDLLKETDLQLKGSRIPPLVVMERLVYMLSNVSVKGRVG